MFYLIPEPKKISRQGKAVSLTRFENLLLPDSCSGSLLDLAVLFADELESSVGKRIRFIRSDVAGCTIQLKRTGKPGSPEAYRLKISSTKILLEAAAENGLFYGLQTLRQLIRTGGNEIPEMVIDDAPDYPVRGFYHDCTRGKIPTLETLFQLADKLAYYKINQLQLYIEHTFAFARHSDMWNGADPLTAEEIIRLDRYCRERHIDLVPSLSTFGHFYMGLRSQRKKHLNELDLDASKLPFSFHDRMAHYTLNASDPDSIKLVEDMLAEFLPLFSSSYFNICCDETFDLGKGKNAAKTARPGATEKLYVDFLLKIIRIVKKYGRTVMFWGDIIASEPELIRMLPPDTIPLEWDYSPCAEGRNTQIMKDSGLQFYVCPGVSGWSTFLNQINIASQNITNYATRGLKFGASGLLNTDWGDYGHVNLLACSYHGLALGAACGWNCRAAAGDLDAFDSAFSAIEFGDPSGKIISCWREFSRHQVFDYAAVSRIFDPSLAEKVQDTLERFRQEVKPDQISNALQTAVRAEEQILAARLTARPLDRLALDEILCGLRGNALMNEIMAAILKFKGYEPRNIADRLRVFEIQFSALWHQRNKPSEYYRVRELLMRISDALDEIG